MNYQECIHYLEEDVGFSSIPGLERIQYLCDLLGNPEQRLPVIHVAGTNGKGSAVAMLSSILKEAGYRVGAYTSPIWSDTMNAISSMVRKFRMMILQRKSP